MATLLRRGKSFNSSHVAAKFELSYKTIIRDLDFMRDRLGWSFEFDRRANTYKLLSAPEPML